MKSNFKGRIKSFLLGNRHPAAQYSMPVFIIGILLACTLFSLANNTYRLHRRIDSNTAKYTREAMLQLADNISIRMKLREIHINSLSRAFSNMPESYPKEQMLDRLEKDYELNELFILHSDGSTIPADIDHQDVVQYSAAHRELFEKPGFFVTGPENVYISSPIIHDNGDRSLLVCHRDEAVLRSMVTSANFNNHGVCCIINSEGQVIVSPTDVMPFSELKDVINKEASGKDELKVRKVVSDIREQRPGYAKLRDVEGNPIVVGYELIDVNDWMLLTIFTPDFLSRGVDGYLVRYVVIAFIMSIIGMLLLVHIIWVYRKSVSKIEEIAFTDTLTGGRNNQAFTIEGESLIKDHPDKTYTIVFFNICNFKRINKRFGIQAGDKVLQNVYDILNLDTKVGEIMARSTGNHFYMLIESGDREAVIDRVSHILDSIEMHVPEKYKIDRTSIARGAFIINDRSLNMMLIKDRAKVASTYQSGDEICRFYDDDLSEQIDYSQQLDEAFADAIKNREFKLYLQPKICPAYANVAGAEALVRWEHPEYGLIYPKDFINLFEKNGKIRELDFYMFEEACRVLSAWLKDGKPIPISVNLSRAHLTANNLEFLNRFKEIKDKYDIPDGLIELELTESLMLERWEIPLVIDLINKIRSMGMLCSLDDFGFGNSSLTLLKDLNINTIKLDRQFFLGESEKSCIVVKQLIYLAHELGITVVAEGIEEKRQVSRLMNCGCDYIQGFVYARPMSVEEFQKLPEAMS